MVYEPSKGWVYNTVFTPYFLSLDSLLIPLYFDFYKFAEKAFKNCCNQNCPLNASVTHFALFIAPSPPTIFSLSNHKNYRNGTCRLVDPYDVHWDCINSSGYGPAWEVHIARKWSFRTPEMTLVNKYWPPVLNHSKGDSWLVYEVISTMFELFALKYKKTTVGMVKIRGYQEKNQLLINAAEISIFKGEVIQNSFNSSGL